MTTQKLPATQGRYDAIATLLNQESIKNRFEQVLGKKAAGFMSSVISAVNANGELKKATPMSVVAAAAVAASLDLPINPSLGFAHIVPYKKDGIPIAQFQMGWRGFVQLGMRSGQYQTLNVCEVYEGELITGNRFTGEMCFDEKQRKSDKIVGYVAYFKLINGFEKYLYMTVEQTKAHGKRYSKSFDHKNGKWQTDFDAMSMKTVVKMLLSKFGVLSIEMQNAVQVDQAIIKTLDGKYEYADNPEGEGDVIDTDPIEDPQAMISIFDASIPKDADPKLVDEFLSEVAKKNKKTLDEIKVAAASDEKELAGLWRIFPGWCKQQVKKAKKDLPAPACLAGAGKSAQVDKENPRKFAPAECPDRPGDIMTKDYCDNTCTKREGCPAWAPLN